MKEEFEWEEPELEFPEDTPLIVEKTGEVYYDPDRRQFFQVRQKTVRIWKVFPRKILICSGFSNYYNDAKTTISEQELPPNHLKNCLKVTAIDKILGVHYDGTGWRSKNIIEEISKAELIEGEIYYDSRTNRFFQLRQISKDHVLVGGFTEYFESASTVSAITTFPLSRKYVQGCELVKDITCFPKAYRDKYGWRVKER